MRKIITLITVIMLSSTTSLQVMACTDNSKFEEFTTYVNSNNAFIGVLGADDAPLCKTVIDSLNIMKSTDNNPTSKWDDYLKLMQPTINKISNNKTIDIHTFIRPPFAKGTVTGDVVDKVWNDKNITWQKNIYHWLLSHMNDDKTYKPPVTNAGVDKITPPFDSDKEKKFTALPIIFIINKGKLVTVGQSWNDKNDFFTQFTNLINGNLLKK